jgi:CAAX amino terminal protease family.
MNIDNDSSISYSKRNAYFAILYYVIYLFITSIFLIAITNNDFLYFLRKIITNQYWSIRVICYLVAAVNLLLIFVFIKHEKRTANLASIGIRKSNLIKSLVVGIVLSIPFVIVKIILVTTKQDTDNRLSLSEFMYLLLCVGLVEEVLFRGYLQSRIEVLFSKKWIAILVCGFMFYISHIVHDIIYQQFNLLMILARLVIIMLMHLVFLYIYKRTKNLTGSIMLHTIIDFMGI